MLSMRKAPRNPFYVVLGVVGFLFTITAASSCLTVLRGVRRETARDSKVPLEVFMHKHGTALLTGQLVVLAVATVGAVALDEYRTRNNKP
jgi:heme/copper-type cytochrome/quinol oxidase subunit 1